MKKLFLLIFAFALLSSCKSKKPAVTETSTIEVKDLHLPGKKFTQELIIPDLLNLPEGKPVLITPAGQWPQVIHERVYDTIIKQTIITRDTIIKEAFVKEVHHIQPAEEKTKWEKFWGNVSNIMYVVLILGALILISFFVSWLKRR